jgi:hypothetical protein
MEFAGIIRQFLVLAMGHNVSLDDLLTALGVLGQAASLQDDHRFHSAPQLASRQSPPAALRRPLTVGTPGRNWGHRPLKTATFGGLALGRPGISTPSLILSSEKEIA